MIEVDGDFEDRELTEAYFSQKMGHKITITVPQRGEQAKLVEMARNMLPNAFPTKYPALDGNFPHWMNWPGY